MLRLIASRHDDDDDDCRSKPLIHSVCLCCCFQVLSLSNNRLEDIHAVTALRGLHVLRVDHNRIVRLPASLSSLRELTILDVSHNRLEAMPPTLADLAARLYR